MVCRVMSLEEVSERGEMCESYDDHAFSDGGRLTFEQKTIDKHYTGVASHWCLEANTVSI